MTTKMERVAPVFPVRDVAAALEHYRRLGFQADAYGERDGGALIYGFVRRGAIELHLARTKNLDPAQNTSSAYLYVDDADRLFAEWSAAGVGGRLQAPSDTPYRLRELVHVDPDGNLLRVGSPLRG